MIYVYSKRTNEILEIPEAIVLDGNKMETLKAVHRDDLRNAFGRIVVENNEPVYKDNTIFIMVEKATNNFTKVDVKGEDSDDYYYAEVKNKDYIVHSAIDSLTNVAKFFKGEFFLFPIEKDKIYDAKTNKWSLDLELFRKSVLETVSGCEDELRQHGFFHNIFGTETFVQPFRNVNKENDQTVLLTQRVATHQSSRRIKVFPYDTTTNKRLSKPGEFYWIMNGQVSDTVLDALLSLMAGYSESVKAGIASLVRKIQETNSIETLKDIKEKYVYMILYGMQQALESSPANKALIEATKKKIKAENIQLVKDNNFVGGSEY